MDVICVDGSISFHNFMPVDEHTVVLQEGKKYRVIDYFYFGPWLFYILEGMGRNAYDSTMFFRCSEQKEKLVNSLPLKIAQC